MNGNAWDGLHSQPRHWLRYPSEHVVRWLDNLHLPLGADAIDIGCGTGRHSELLTDYTCRVTACDASEIALSHIVSAVETVQADMTALPFDAAMFDVALAYGVFYYGTPADTDAAISEMHRVLRPGGHGFVSVRTHADSRATGARPEAETGMDMTFMAEEDIPRAYAAFADVTYELTETTRGGRSWVDSDWLIKVTK